MKERKRNLIKQASQEIRSLASIIEKTSSEKLDSEKVMDFLRFYKGKGQSYGKQ